MVSSHFRKNARLLAFCTTGLAFACVLVIAGCGGGNSNSATGNRATLRATTKVLPQDGSVIVNQVDPTHITLTGSSVPNVLPGDVIVSGAGEGMLVKASAVSATPGGLSVIVTPASLADAVSDMHAKFQAPITQANVKSITPGTGVTANWISASAGRASSDGQKLEFTLPLLTLYDADGNPDTKNDQLNVVLKVDITPSGFLNIDADWSSIIPSLETVEAGLNWNADLDVTLARGKDAGPGLGKTLAIDKSGDIELGSVELEPIVFSIGIFPVVVTQSIDFKLHYEFKLDADLNPHLTTNITGRLGAGYSGGQAYTINELTSSAPSLSFAFGQVNGSSKVELPNIAYQTKLYGVVGPFISAAPYFEADLAATLVPPSLDLGASIGIEGSAGIRGKIFSKNIDFSKTFVDVKLWEKTYHKDLSSSTDVTVQSLRKSNSRR
ncbi:MAG: exported protein of unknown function [Chthonomonadaceae bacterium]|nr:exported protein of unknown function [Chthonomonadaceae bacterium]